VSKHFLSLLMAEYPDLAPEVQRLLLRPKSQLASKDQPLFQKEVTPNINKWARALKKQYGKAGRPHEWANELKGKNDLDVIDILMLDVIGRVAVYGDRPITSLGYAAAVLRTLSWVSMAGIIAALWRRENLWAAGAVMLTILFMFMSRSLAVQDIFKRYQK